MRYNDDSYFFMLSTKIWAFLLACVLGTLLVFGVLKPYFADLDTAGVRRTHDYIDSHQNALRLLAGDYTRLSTEINLRSPGIDQDALIRQRSAVREQMRGIADTIPRHVPSDVAGYLQESP